MNNSGKNGGTRDADIDALEAWGITTGSQDVIVGIIDTGVDYSHPDLVDNMWNNPCEIPGNNKDDDHNGYIDDVHGINAITDSGDPRDDQGHGSHVAGTIGAKGNNGLGVVGVNWNVRIVACKFLDSNGSGSIADATKCFMYFNHLKQKLGQNILVTNNSWGGGAFSQAVKDSMAATGQPGMAPILHAVAAGNSNHDNDAGPSYPASYDLDNILAVAATDHNDLYASFSNYGATTVDLAAPGVAILSTVPNGGCGPKGLCDSTGYRTLSGTSMATPHVTGAAALVSARYPGLSAAQLKQRLLWGGDYIGGLEGNASKSTRSNRRLNVYSSLDNDTSAPAAITGLAVSGSGVISVTLSWTASGDNGTSGTAAAYDVRYSMSSPLKWDTATLAAGGPSPQPAGATESFTVSGLDPSATYYFAVRVIDDVGNKSSQSGVVSGSTGAGTVAFADDMEAGKGGWTTGGSDGLWHKSSFITHSPDTAWWYGIAGQYDYDTGAPNWGTLTSPAIDLSGATEALLTFHERSRLEAWVLYDRTRVQVSTNRTDWETIFESHGTSWAKRSVVLTPYVGKKLYLRFWFDSRDHRYNSFEGWYVDDVQVVTSDGLAPPAPPDGLSATAGDGQVGLDWADNTEPDLAGYNVHRSTTSNLGSYSQVASQVVASEYTDTGLTNGTTYYYTVTAVDGAGNQSADSEEASGTPEAEPTPAPEPPPEPTPTPAPPGSANALYVWDIYFESRTKGKGGQTHDERVTVVVRWDSDGDGLAEASDELVAGATVRLILTGPGLNADFSGDTSNGKKNQGVFSTGWLPDLAVGVYAAEVTGLAHADYTWDRALEPTSNVADADGDTLPDRQHNLPH